MKKQIQSSFILLSAAMIWGFTFVAQLLGSNSVGTFTFGGVRFILGALTLIPVILIFERGKTEPQKIKRTIVTGFISGTILFMASTLQQFGIHITGSAGKSGFITGLYMVIVPIIGIFLRRRTSINIWFGVAFAVAGLYLLSFSDGIGSVGIGDILLLLGAVLFAIHIIVIDKFVNDTYAIRLSMIQAAICGIMSLICAFAFEDISVDSIIDARFSILYSGIMSSGIAYMLQVVGQKNADPTLATIMMSTESIFSVIGELIVFTFLLTNIPHKSLTVGNYIGCVLMFIGILLAQIDFKRIKTDRK